MKTDEALMKQVAVDVLANPRANRTAARLAKAYLELLVEREKPKRYVRPPRALSCGCCTGGCVCWHHQDTPNGMPVMVCAYHREHGHPGITEAP